MHTYRPGQYEMARCDSVHMEYIFGEWRQTKDFSYYLAFDTTETTGLMRYYSTLAEGLDMIYNGGTSDYGFIYYLKGAVIDGILYGDTTYVSIDDGKIQESTSDSFELFQNYPNPFNSQTIIKYGLIKSSEVKIIIYDILGNKIVDLVNSTQSAGQYQVIWNGRDNTDNVVASGLYIYQLKSGNNLQRRKMLFIR